MRAPVLAALFLVVTMATLAIPGSANFVGEFLILNGIFNAKIVYAIVAGAGVVLAAVYALRLYQRSMHNPLARGRRVARPDACRSSRCSAPIVAVIVALAPLPAVRAEAHRASTAVSVARRRPRLRSAHGAALEARR